MLKHVCSSCRITAFLLFQASDKARLIKSKITPKVFGLTYCYPQPPTPPCCILLHISPLDIGREILTTVRTVYALVRCHASHVSHVTCVTRVTRLCKVVSAEPTSLFITGSSLSSNLVHDPPVLDQPMGVHGLGA